MLATLARHRVQSSCRHRLALAAILAAALPGAALAQDGDAAYCAALSDLARRYISQPGDQRSAPDLDVSIALDDCRTGKTARAIPVLERKLTDRRFTLPKR